MLKKYPILSRFSVFLVLPILIFVIAAYWSIEQSLPNYSGQMVLDGIVKPVTVEFDNYGTPTVNAQTDRDAYFAQGYLHASERFWQMELQRRIVQGRNSEVLGRAAYATDLWMRTLGLKISAEKAWESIGLGAKNALTAYAAGVNAWINSIKELPPEFVILGIEPEQWTEIDSLAWQKVLALNLGLNMYGEMNRLSALKVISPQQLKTFYEYDPDIAPVELYEEKFQTNKSNDLPMKSLLSKLSVSNDTVNEKEHQRFRSWQELTNNLEQTWSLGIPYTGSNSWAVSGKYTKSGNPILANDPHLGVQQNSPWYAIQLKGDKLDVTGVSLVGIPGVALGRNRNIAWGTTSLMSDQQDLFYLEVPLDDNTSYFTDEKRRAIEVVTETIKIRADAPDILNKVIQPVEIEIRRTDIGPVVSDAVQAKGEAVVLRWSALDNDDRSYESFYQLQYATNWQEFRSAVSLLKAPGLHFVYADKAGNIGSQVAGHMPVRGSGVGILPQHANKSDNLWQGYVPFEQLPNIYNPRSGVVVSANNKIESDKGIVISHEWAPMARNKRINYLINDLVDSGHSLTIQDMVKIQNDTVDLNAKFLYPLLQRKSLINLIRKNATEDTREMVDHALIELSQWNTEYRVSSAAASIYEYWLNEIRSQIFYNELNPAWNNANVSNDLIEGVSEEQLAKILANENNQWCVKSNDIPCQSELIDSFYSAIDLLSKQTGSENVADWQWGELHHIEFSHALFSNVVEKPFKQKIPMGGSINTINIAIWVKYPSGGYRKSLGASVRQVFDLGSKGKGDTPSEEKNAYILPTGQSGHFLSAHYGDQTSPYMNGEINYFKTQNGNTVISSEELKSDPHDGKSVSSIIFVPKRNL